MTHSEDYGRAASHSTKLNARNSFPTEIKMLRVDSFNRLDDEYFRRNGQFAVGRITTEQFDAPESIDIRYDGHYRMTGCGAITKSDGVVLSAQLP